MAQEGPITITPLVRYYQEGNSALKNGDPKKALRLLTKALRAYDNSHESLDDLATVYCARSMANFRLKDYEASRQDAIECVTRRPHWSKGFFRLAEAQFELGSIEESLSSYQKAQELIKDEGDRSADLVALRIIKVQEQISLREGPLVLRPLRPGHEICRGTFNPIKKLVFEFARGMQNIVYIIGDRRSRDCIIVDACWDADGVLEEVRRLDLHPIACIVTHNHFDHYGGKPPPPFGNFGITVSGVRTILNRYEDLSVYIHEADADAFQTGTNIDPTRIRTTTDGQILWVGEPDRGIKLQIMHTPGHTPGAQCILISSPTDSSNSNSNDEKEKREREKKRLLTGDTLFVGSCGRMDLPGGCPVAMFHSLQHRLATLPGDILIYPGHSYGGNLVSTIDRERQVGVLKETTLEEWLRLITGTATQSPPNRPSCAVQEHMPE